MKLTKEDIRKYSTEEEIKLLEEFELKDLTKSRDAKIPLNKNSDLFSTMNEYENEYYDAEHNIGNKQKELIHKIIKNVRNYALADEIAKANEEFKETFEEETANLPEILKKNLAYMLEIGEKHEPITEEKIIEILYNIIKE